MTLPPQRELFDIPDDVAYFNCAYNSPQLNASRARLRSGVDSKSHPWERTPASFFEDADRIRALAAGIFGGDADGYAIVPAASYGISSAARAIEPRLRPGDRILVMAEEFPSNFLPWQRAAAETGASLSAVPKPDGGGWTRAFLNRIDRSVKVVAVSTCHWTDGARVELAPIAAACREVGGLLVVDATQSLGAMPLPVGEVRPDFLVAAGYKWLLGPYGFGLLYVSERWRSARPLEEVWLARQGAENFAALADYSAVYQPGARRFDVGEKCTPTLLPGAIAALEQIAAWGVDRIAVSLAAVNQRVAAHLERLGFHLPDSLDRCPHLFGARLPSGAVGNLVGELKARRIFVSQRGDAVRIAPHLHVTPQDVDRLVLALDELLDTDA
jgi:selenocysteine lyase/cysteine desulfurase